MVWIYPESEEIREQYKWLYLSLTVVRLELISHGSLLGTATGFFYSPNKDLDKIFLVTCRHNIIDEEDKHYPNKVGFKVHTSLDDLSKNSRKEIELYNSDGTKNWIDSDKEDIALIEIKSEYLEGCFIAGFSNEDFFSNFRSGLYLQFGDDVLVLGYPEGCYDAANNMPIARMASMASMYDVGFNRGSYFLIDSNLHEGTSGAPVIYTGQSFRKKDGGLNIIGSHIELILGINRGPLTRYGGDLKDLGLHYVHYIEILEDILE